MKQHSTGTHIANCGTAISQFVNTWFLFGDPDQSISARCYVNRRHSAWKHAYTLVNLLVFWQDNHCYTAFKGDLDRAKTTIKEYTNDKQV